MSINLSTPVKIVALVGVLLACAGAGLFLLNRNQSSSKSETVATRATHVRTHPATTHHSAAPSGARFVASLPAPLVHALRHSKVVVAVVWAKGDPVAADTLAQAKVGARMTHSKLVVLDVDKNSIAGQTATWMKSDIVEPAVLVVRRPGKIAVELPGYTDRLAVAQAVLNSRR